MRVPVIKNVTVNTSNHTTGWFVDKEQTNAHLFFFYIECVCNAWFTFEIMVSEMTMMTRRCTYVYGKAMKIKVFQRAMCVYVKNNFVHDIHCEQR
jgi:hypothetical protein